MRETVRHWFASKWLAPNAFKRKALVDTLHGLYIPYWTFDARVHCPWRAEAGHYYYEKQGNNQVRRVRWTPASGVDRSLLRRPADSRHQGHRPRPARRRSSRSRRRTCVPYDTAYLSGHVVEQYQVILVDAAEQGLARMQEEVRQMCIEAIPGDTYQNLQMSPTWTGRTFKHVLVPVYVMTYMYGRQSYQVVVNASNGRMGGTYPISWVKVALIIIAILIVLAIVNR